VRRTWSSVKSSVSESGRRDPIETFYRGYRSERPWHYRALGFRGIRANVASPNGHSQSGKFYCVRQGHSLVIYRKVLSRVMFLYRIVSKFRIVTLASILSFRNLAA